MTKEAYDQLIIPYEDALQLMALRLGVLEHRFSEDSGHKMIHDIQKRVKKKASIERKLQVKGLKDSLESARENLKDIAGIRVICYFTKDIDLLADALKKQQGLVKIQEKITSGIPSRMDTKAII